MDIIAINLKNQIEPQKLIKGIVELIQKNVKSKEDAESSVLTIQISRISKIIDPSNEPKRIE